MGEMTLVGDGVLTDLFVSNAETGNATARVTLTDAYEKLTYQVSISDATEPGRRVFKRVRLYHPATGSTLNASVTPVGIRDAAALDNAASGKVVWNGTSTAPLRAIDVKGASENGTRLVRVTLVNDDLLTVGTPVTVALNGTTIPEVTTTVAPDATDTVSLNAPSTRGRTKRR